MPVMITLDAGAMSCMYRGAPPAPGAIRIKSYQIRQAFQLEQAAWGLK